MYDDEEQLDAALAHKQKKDKEELAGLAQLDKDMDDLDALEQVEKSMITQMWESIEHWLLGNKPGSVLPGAPFDPKRIADVRYTVYLKKTCGCSDSDATTKFVVYLRKPSAASVIECDYCSETMLIDDLTITNIDVVVAPSCIGCEKPIWDAKEGELRLCEKCNTIWSRVNQAVSGYPFLGAKQSPMPGNIIRRLSDFGGSYTDPVSYDIVKDLENANLISSEVAGTLNHKPVLDIDLPCKLVPSTNAGHYHLYIDKAMSWVLYKKLLAVLAEVGIIQGGYKRASEARGFSSVRLPWIKKEPVGKQEG